MTAAATSRANIARKHTDRGYPEVERLASTLAVIAQLWLVRSNHIVDAVELL